jgi:hypothetical protein
MAKEPCAPRNSGAMRSCMWNSEWSKTIASYENVQRRCRRQADRPSGTDQDSPRKNNRAAGATFPRPFGLLPMAAS